LGRAAVKPLKPKTRRSLFLLNAILLIIPITYFGYPYLLRGLTHILIVNEQPAQADAIAVLAGDPGRAVEAADLFKRNIARNVIITTELPPSVYDRARRDGISLVWSYENYIRLLQGYGVPAVNIFRIESYIGDTMDEVDRIGTFARGKQWNRLVIVTSNFHTRRTRMVARYLLEPELKVIVVASHYDSFTPDSWWKSQAQTRTFAIELEKLITYSFYIWPRMLWNSRENTRPRNTLLALPDFSVIQDC
jgi:uncharacterized SAM-binding protein YcdF (DUF218 family)